jgi:tetratricopeptide (TPR) repeat protein
LDQPITFPWCDDALTPGCDNNSIFADQTMNDLTSVCDPAAFQRLVDAVAAADDATALHLLDDALIRWPTDGRLHFLRASLLAETRRVDDAATGFAAALAHEPSLHIARFQLGLLLLSSSHADAALRVWEPLDALDPADPLRLFRRGLTALTAARFAEAIDLLRQGIAVNSAFPPLNRDMQGVIDRASAQLAPAPAVTVPAAQPAPAESARHLLLAEYLASKTRH